MTTRAVIDRQPEPWLFLMVTMLVVFTLDPLFYNIWLRFHEYAPIQRRLV